MEEIELGTKFVCILPEYKNFLVTFVGMDQHLVMGTVGENPEVFYWNELLFKESFTFT